MKSLGNRIAAEMNQAGLEQLIKISVFWVSSFLIGKVNSERFREYE